MLVAGPSHSSYHSYSTSDIPSSSTHRRDSSSKSNGSSTASDTNSNSSSLSSKYNLIKTFAERLNRGTELIKQTVQKAILPKKITPDDPLILSPGKIHRRTTTMTPESDSGDSLKIEVTSHFKPIRIMPQTPKRRNQSSLKHPTPKLLQCNVGAQLRLNNFKPLVCPRKLVRSQSSAFLALATSSVKQCDNKYDAKEKNDSADNDGDKSNQMIDKADLSAISNSSNESKISSRRGVKRKVVTITGTEAVRKSTRTKTKTSIKHSINNKKLKIDITTGATAATSLTLKEQQERNDYEFAKKLQSQLNANITIFDDDDESYVYSSKIGSSNNSNIKNTNNKLLNNNNRNSNNTNQNSNQEKCYNLRRTNKPNLVKPQHDETFVAVRRSTRRKNISY